MEESHKGAGPPPTLTTPRRDCATGFTLGNMAFVT